jgi:hemolysin III
VDYLRDPVSSASHFFTAFFAVGVSLFLVRMTRGDSTRRFYVMIFAGCMTALYLASGLYHALRLPTDELRFFQLIDMSAIYLMIAGSATPPVALVVRGRLRSILLVGEWSIATLGILALWLLPQQAHEVLIACYFCMGWLGCACLGQLWRANGWQGARWFIAATGSYMIGAVVELLNWPIPWPGVVGYHEILHFCDMAGTAFYLIYLVKYVIPYSAPATVAETAEAFAAPAQA